MAKILEFSTGLKNYLLGTGSLLDALNTSGAASASGCAIQLYGGTNITIPASPDDAATGTVLGTIKNGGSFITWTADTGNVQLKKTVSETWSCTIGTASNVQLYYFRIIMDDGDIGTDASTTDKRIQGSITPTGASAADYDLYMSNSVVNTSDSKSIAAFTLSIADA